MDGTSSKSSPESRPLKTWDAVVNWEPEDETFCVGNVPLKARTRLSAASPRTLVCHDLAGGYIDDRFVQGVDRDDLYVFYHWQYVDVFVYFSHNFITIPPPCWINAAHRHGVKVLGTLITEWDEGAKITEEFLSDEDAYKMLVEKLVQIAKFYNFDGWLVNIENEVPVTKVRLMCDFLELLHESMHASHPESEVIWYDSILHSGKLDWQNALNERNSLFFDRCDGIFLNYNWTEANLVESKEMSAREHRTLDVYVGVDVFGRGCLGGGGWNTIEAVTAARCHNMSVAIFAPGWVYEKLDKTDFIANNNRFWAILSDMCPSHGPASFPFATSFCPGFGKKYFVHGQEVSCHPWTNMSVQHVQPTFTQQQFHGNKRTQMYQPIMGLHQAASCNGGGCLQLSGCLATEGIPLVFNLYNTNLRVPSSSLFVTYSFMQLNKSQCGVFLQLKGSINGEDVCLVLDDKTEDKMSKPDDELARNRKTYVCKKCNLDDMETLVTGCKEYMAADDSLWSTRYFMLGADIVGAMVIDTISLGLYLDGTSEDRSEVLLGQIRILPTEYLKEPLPEITNLSYHSQEIGAALDKKDGFQKSLSVTLTWTTNNDRFVGYYYIWENEQFIGQAASNTYRICEYLPKKSEDGEVVIIIQPVLSLGFEVPKDKCPTKVIPFV